MLLDTWPPICKFPSRGLAIRAGVANADAIPCKSATGKLINKTPLIFPGSYSHCGLSNNQRTKSSPNDAFFQSHLTPPSCRLLMLDIWHAVTLHRDSSAYLLFSASDRFQP